MMVWAFLISIYIFVGVGDPVSIRSYFFLPSMYTIFIYFLSLKLPFAFVYYILFIIVSFFEEFFMERSPYVYYQ
jgi:hypothetical protein